MTVEISRKHPARSWPDQMQRWLDPRWDIDSDAEDGVPENCQFGDAQPVSVSPPRLWPRVFPGL
jgi:hypothetical protein